MSAWCIYFSGIGLDIYIYIYIAVANDRCTDEIDLYTTLFGK